MSGNKKLIDIVDDNDNIVGKGTYEEVVEAGRIFRSANIMVFNSKGMIFVHKRNRNLQTFAGMWDVKLGGIVDEGETYEEAAARELNEEAGIKNAKLEFIFPLKFRKGGYRNNRKVYKCAYDGKMKLQAEEIEEGRFVAIEEAKKMLREGMLSPSAEAVFEEFLKNEELTEYVDVVDEEDKFVRKATRREMREKALLHRAAKIILINKEGNFIVQKRSLNKDIFPGLWELGVGETVKSGDSYEAAAISGLEDEIGAIGVSNIQLKHSLLFKLRCSSAKNNVHYKVYLLNHHGRLLKGKEVDEIRFLSRDDLNKWIDAGVLEPESTEIFQKYVEMMTAGK